MKTSKPEAQNQSYVAFVGHRKFAEGDRRAIALAMHAHVRSEDSRDVQVFDLETGLPVQLDTGGSEAEVRARYSQEAIEVSDDSIVSPSVRRSRPKAVERKVALLPRHWEWLDSQPSGVSAALRRAVDGARKSAGRRDLARRSQDRTYRFLSSVAGDLPGFEEGVRALYAADSAAFSAITAHWPADIAGITAQISRDAFLPSDP